MSLQSDILKSCREGTEPCDGKGWDTELGEQNSSFFPSLPKQLWSRFSSPSPLHPQLIWRTFPGKKVALTCHCSGKCVWEVLPLLPPTPPLPGRLQVVYHSTSVLLYLHEVLENKMIIPFSAFFALSCKDSRQLICPLSWLCILSGSSCSPGSHTI